MKNNLELNEMFIEKILAKLKKVKISIEDLNLETQYFLDNIE